MAKKQAGAGRFVSVTSAQKRAAAALIERSKTTGKTVPDSVVKIANAKPRSVRGVQIDADGGISHVHFDDGEFVVRHDMRPADVEPDYAHGDDSDGGAHRADGPGRAAKRRVRRK